MMEVLVVELILLPLTSCVGLRCCHFTIGGELGINHHVSGGFSLLL